MQKQIPAFLIAAVILSRCAACADTEPDRDRNPKEYSAAALANRAEESDSILLSFAETDSVEIVMNFCMNDLNLNRAASCGIAANMTAESGLRTYALGDAGTSYGLCQWHNERWDRLKSFAAGAEVPECDVDIQLNYFRHEMETCFPELLHELRNIPDSEDGAYKAGYIFCTEYEKPEYADIKGDCRGRWAVSEYKSMREYSSDCITEVKIRYMLQARAGELNSRFTVPDGGFATSATAVSVDYSPDFWKAELYGWDNSWLGSEEYTVFDWASESDDSMAFADCENGTEGIWQEPEQDSVNGERPADN